MDFMIFGVLVGIVVFYFSGVLKWSEVDLVLINGMRMMVFIGFVMLLVSGFVKVF